MAKYQKKLTLEAVAARRNQTLAQLIAEWGVTTVEDLTKRCKREDVDAPTDFTFAIPAVKTVEKPPVKNALVDLSKESEELAAKKAKRGKLTSDEPTASDEHVGVVTRVPSGPKDAS